MRVQKITCFLIFLVFDVLNLRTMTTQTAQGQNQISTKTIRFVDEYPGSDAGTKIARAIADLSSTGGIVDARGLEGSQSIGSSLSLGSPTKPVTLLLGSASFTLIGESQLLLFPNSRIVGLGPQATIFFYSGSGTAVRSHDQSSTDTANGSELNSFKLTRVGPVGSTIGISLRSVWRSQIVNIQVDNFGIGIDVDGMTGGTYFNIIEQCYVTSSKTGIRMTGGNGQAANSNTIRDNRIVGATTGILGVAGSDIVLGNFVYRNDVEEFADGTSYGIDYHGDNSVLSQNWVEASARDGSIYTGIRLRGDGNLLLNNKYGILASGGTANQLDKDDSLENSYLELSTGGRSIQQFSTSIIPGGSRKDLGSTVARWDLYGRSLDIVGPIALNAAASTTGYATDLLQRNSLANALVFRAGVSNLANGLQIIQDDSSNLLVLFSPNANGYARMTSGKGLGVLTPAAPAVALDVTGAIRSSLKLLSFSATPNFDAKLGNSFKITLVGNVSSSSISNSHAGQIITLLLCQDGIGSRTMAWPATLKLARGSFVLTPTANKCDSITAIYDGSNWYEIGRSSDL